MIYMQLLKVFCEKKVKCAHIYEELLVEGHGVYAYLNDLNVIFKGGRKLELQVLINAFHRFCLKHVFLTLISLIKNVRLGSTVVEIELKIELQCLGYMQNNRAPMGKLNKLKLNWALFLLI